MRRDLLFALDPVLWCRDVLGLALDPQQARLVASRGRRELLNCSRQWGKSTATAAAVLHEAVYVPGSRTVVVAPSARQSSLLLASVEGFANRAAVAFSPLGGDDPGLRFAGGEIIALPSAEATTRGLSGVTWLIVDEAARVGDDLWHSVRAYLATTGGRIWLLSTPFGQRGFFYEESKSGRYHVTRVPASECPRISPEFLQEQKVSMPLAWFLQEYACEFTSVDGGVFDHGLVAASLSDDVEALW